MRKSSSWASWSAVSTSGDSFNENDLQNVRKRLEEKTRELLRQDESSPPQGFQRSARFDEWVFSVAKSLFINIFQICRSRRASKDFDNELRCPTPGCTQIKCTIGALQKDENIVLKVRSRLYTQTLIKVAIQMI